MKEFAKNEYLNDWTIERKKGSRKRKKDKETDEGSRYYDIFYLGGYRGSSVGSAIIRVTNYYFSISDAVPASYTINTFQRTYFVPIQICLMKGCSFL